MSNIVNTIDEYEALIEECSTHLFTVQIPESLAMEIVADYPEHREALARNKTISEPVIRKLALDEDPEVRWRISHKRATPPDVQIELASDPSEDVRSGICRNPKVPREALEILAEDSVDWIREDARERLNSRD
ncbi:MAG: hypothetical protein ACLFVJ_20005 [Persicimonas sp.]